MVQTNYKSGDVYHNLTLTGKSYSTFSSGRMRRFLECLCVCGSISYRDTSSVRGGLVKSCGCQNNGSTTHGLSYDPIYTAWISMKGRCYNEDDISYPNYGGRGTIVCDEWVNNPVAFIEWARSNGWEEGLSLDRFPNTNGNYEPTNCRWATFNQQMRNRRYNHFVTAFGETKVFADWVKDERCTVSHGELYRRLIKKKMLPEDAISTPKNN